MLMPSVWQERYAAKLKSAQEALSVVRRGFQVFISSPPAQSRFLLEALARLSAQWGDGDVCG
jgi:acyl-CoA hydrolase